MVLLYIISANQSCMLYISVKMRFNIFSIYSDENISVCKFYSSPHWLQSDLCPKHIVQSHFLKRRNKQCYLCPVKGSWPLRTSVLTGLAVQIVLSLNSFSDSNMFSVVHWVHWDLDPQCMSSIAILECSLVKKKKKKSTSPSFYLQHLYIEGKVAFLYFPEVSL